MKKSIGKQVAKHKFLTKNKNYFTLLIKKCLMKKKKPLILQLKAKQNIMTKFKYGRQFNSRDVRKSIFILRHTCVKL